MFCYKILSTANVEKAVFKTPLPRPEALEAYQKVITSGFVGLSLIAFRTIPKILWSAEAQWRTTAKPLRKMCLRPPDIRRANSRFAQISQAFSCLTSVQEMMAIATNHATSTTKSSPQQNSVKRYID